MIQDLNLEQHAEKLQDLEQLKDDSMLAERHHDQNARDVSHRETTVL